MRRIAAALGIGLAMLSAPALSADETALNAYLESVRAEYGLPAVAAAVVSAGEITEAGAVGVRALGRDTPVTIDDRFHIGSDTKAMTATLAGMMVEEGKLRWDSTVGEVLGDRVPGMNPALAAVTLEQLLSHSSGIPSDTPEMVDLYFNANAFDYNLTDLRLRAIDAWKENAPVVPEGSPFQYSNFGYIIAGTMIETVAGESWEELIRERVFEPLGLTTAGFGPQTTTGRLDAPAGHLVAEDGTVVPILWGPAEDSPPMVGPAGTVHMSVLDFAKWAGWNAGAGHRPPALVSPETLAVIQSPHVRTPVMTNPRPGTPTEGEYGLGWGIGLYDWAARPLLNHNGSNQRAIAKILVDTQADFAVVAVTNLGGPKAEAAAAAIIQHIYEEYGPKE